jgi:hypothetical protein
MQPAAAGFVVIMLGAIRLKAVQMHRGFGVDGGWELDVVPLTAAFALVFVGYLSVNVVPYEEAPHADSEVSGAKKSTLG